MLWFKKKSVDREQEAEKKPSFFGFGMVSKKDVLLFTKNISILLKAGSTISESIRVLEEGTKGKWKRIVADILTHIEKGLPLSEALGHYPKVFSPIYKGMVEIGERSGTLEDNLAYIASFLEKSHILRKKILGSLMYPFIVLVGVIVLGAAVALFILPKITRLFRNFQVELPLTTRILLVVSDFFQAHGTVAIPAFFLGGIFLLWFLRRRFLHPVTHWLILKIPITKNISQHFNLSMFSRTLNILLSSGVSIDDGLLICANTSSNFYYKRHLTLAYSQVKGGENLSAVLSKRKDLFPATDIQILRVGESSGTLSDSLKYCAENHEDAVEDITKNLANMLEPIILLMLGGMVAILALSIITPIYSITQKFRG